MLEFRPYIRFELIHQFIQDPKNTLSVTELCTIAGVSRSGYYRWLESYPKRRERELQDQHDFELILEAYKKHGRAKGARGIHMTLLHLKEPVVMNLKKIRRLMEKYNLLCPIRRANPYRRMAKAIRTNRIAEYLLDRRFTELGPRMVLLTDITYLPYNGRYCYLSTILDGYTRQVLSYVLSESLEVDFVLETVEKLILDHGISLHQETIINSDQGCHYTSRKFIELLENVHLRQSMSHKGVCWDNAPQESFFGHMKDEIDIRSCKTFLEVKFIIDSWMDYYNNHRYQWQLAKLSPNEFYEFVTTGKYPLPIENPPDVPVFSKVAIE